MSNYNQNPEIRRHASSLARQNIGRILLMYLAMFGVTMAVFLVFAVIAALSCLPAIIEAAEDMAYYSSRYYSRSIFDFLDIESIVPGMILLFAMLPILGFVATGLSMGVTNGMIRISRGEQVSVGVVFSRLKNCFTCFGMTWWMSLKLSLWALVGYIPLLLGALLTAISGSELPMLVLSFVSVVVICVCVIMATYRYSMAPYFIADEPKTGTFGSVERSKLMMNGRKFQLFKLCLPYTLINLAISLVVFVITYLLNLVLPYDLRWIATVISFVLSLVSMVVSIYLSILITMTQACFYTTHCGELASADYKPLYRLTMHNRQVRKHSLTTVNLNIGKVLCIDLINGAINGAIVLIFFLFISLLAAIVTPLMRSRDTAFIAMIILYVVMFVLMLVIAAFINALNLGRCNAHIKMARGEIVPITTLFSRLRNFMGALGLNLWVSLKIFLWALPGIALMIVGSILSAFATASYYDTNVFLAVLGGIMAFAGIILLLVLVIRAAFNYMLSTYAYADKPEKGVFNAVEQSIWIMNGCKLQMFRLQWPYIFLTTGVLLGLMLFALLGFMLHVVIGTIFTVIAVLVGIVAMVYISYLSSLATACFYTKYSYWDKAAAEARAAAALAQQQAMNMPQMNTMPYQP